MGLSSSISAAICIFSNNLGVDVGQREWGTDDEASVNLNQYATIVYWPCPPEGCVDNPDDNGGDDGNGGIDGVSGEDVGGKKIFATSTVAGITTLVFGIFLSIF